MRKRDSEYHCRVFNTEHYLLELNVKAASKHETVSIVANRVLELWNRQWDYIDCEYDKVQI
ncbi:MAG: hypothetical protein HRF49_00010 [bacterium]|jgi:hypothetical protein